jgi:hypothetical protein
MKGTAFITTKGDRLCFMDIPIKEELVVGDYIKLYPEDGDQDNYNNQFTDDEINDGIDLIVRKRVYSTIDGMMYYCDYAEEL